jgi:hypothetical protein
MSKEPVPCGMENETKTLRISGIAYDADRITDSAGIGYIELRRPGGEEPLARINYHGPGNEMGLCTYGNALPLSAVRWLLDRGEYALMQ